MKNFRFSEQTVLPPSLSFKENLDRFDLYRFVFWKRNAAPFYLSSTEINNVFLWVWESINAKKSLRAYEYDSVRCQLVISAGTDRRSTAARPRTPLPLLSPPSPPTPPHALRTPLPISPSPLTPTLFPFNKEWPRLPPSMPWLEETSVEIGRFFRRTQSRTNFGHKSPFLFKPNPPCLVLHSTAQATIREKLSWSI